MAHVSRTMIPIVKLESDEERLAEARRHTQIATDEINALENLVKSVTDDINDIPQEAYHTLMVEALYISLTNWKLQEMDASGDLLAVLTDPELMKELDAKVIEVAFMYGYVAGQEKMTLTTVYRPKEDETNDDA